jgi:hypothetical protein
MMSEYRGLGPNVGGGNSALSSGPGKSADRWSQGLLKLGGFEGGGGVSRPHPRAQGPVVSSCPACQEELVDRCGCCLKEKLSLVPRMKVAVVGKRLASEHAELTGGEAMPPEKLVAAIADYARSSAVAAKVTNQR